MEIVNRIEVDINKVKGRITKQYRDIAKKYNNEIRQYHIEDIYHVCELLLNQKKWAETIIAYQIIFDHKKKYNEDTFHVFEKWLFNYIEDWWDCDDFMTHAFQYVLMLYPDKIKHLLKWVNHEKFAVRRSAAVILIRPAQKGLLDKNIIFGVCNLLINDPHHLVQKGYGWLLKESYKHYQYSVISYLEENVSNMSRTAFRYAVEKLPKEEKIRLMSLK